MKKQLATQYARWLHGTVKEMTLGGASGPEIDKELQRILLLIIQEEAETDALKQVGAA